MAVGVKQRIQSLDRGLQILEYVAQQDGPVRLQVLAELLSVERSSAQRLAQTLADRGYLKQDPTSHGYLLDNKVFALANRLAGQRSARDHSRKFLRILAQKTGETAHLAVRGEINAVLVDHEFSSNPLAVTTHWGSTEPYHCTALGKALLAGMKTGDLLDIFGAGRLERYTKNTITRLADLAKQCLQVQHDQIAYDLGEFREDINCLASPVYDFRGGVVAAIGISGPAERIARNGVEKLSKIVKQCAEELSAELGYQPERPR